MKKAIFVAVIITAFTAVSLKVYCEESPLQVVKKNIDQIINTLTNKKLTPKEKKKKIKEILEYTIDWPEVSKRVLGIHYRRLKPEQIEKFEHLFKEFVKNVYAKKFLKYSGEKIVYEKEIVEGNYASVKMKLITTDNQEIPMVCKLLKRGDKWYVYDVLIEGISMVNNYRIQINKIIARKGFSGLIRILEKKVSRIKD